MTQRERFLELATRWMALRMQFHRWTGEQPGESLDAILSRLRERRALRAKRRSLPID